MTEVALAGHSLFRIEDDGLVGTGLQAGPTARTPLFVQDHDAVGSLADSPLRAGGQATGLLAVSAQVEAIEKEGPTLGHPGTILHYPDQAGASRKAMLLLARHLAGSAAPALLLLDLQEIPSHCLSFSSSPPLPHPRSG
jgi:hypothetical protein